MTAATTRSRRATNFLRRHRWPMTMLALLAATAGVIAGWNLAGMPARLAQAAPAAAEQAILVHVETTSGAIGNNHNDIRCVYAEMQYELRDADGTLVAAGQIAEDGVSAGDSRWASTGLVMNDPYRCVAEWPLDVPAADLYELTVSAGGSSETVLVTGPGTVEVQLR